MQAESGADARSSARWQFSLRQLMLVCLESDPLQRCLVVQLIRSLDASG